MFLKNARLAGGACVCVRVLKGLVAEIGASLKPHAHEEVLDCEFKTLLPSAIDLGVFLHNLNRPTYAHLKAQAYKGGVGSLMGVPLAPLYSLKEADMEPLEFAQEYSDTAFSPLDYGAAREAIACGDVICLHPLGSDQRLQDLALLRAMLPASIQACLYLYNLEGQKLLPVLDYARMLSLKLVCGVRGYEGRFSMGIMDQTPLAYALGLPSVSPLIQVKEVGKVAGLALHTQLDVLLDSVVEPDAFKIITATRALGAPLWVQTPLHHLILEESIYQHYDPRTKILPPLKDKEKQAHLRALLAQEIDMLTSLHYTHPLSLHIFEDAPFGMQSIEAFFPLAYTHLVASGCISLQRLIELIATNPARFLGLNCGALEVGKEARLMLVDLKGKSQVDNPASIYHQQVLKARVEWIMRADGVVYL
ncbi:amidohydrolase family protein [Helicobacter baculiformis]|uniref:Amidohydrolase family protein n=1 Tax=Helicobacter baculiformis TaxID=427351 RepID=A0ABV7ZG58_9HELI|nr:amidohydrolase family protein [Helicobacter baculiformis]